MRTLLLLSPFAGAALLAVTGKSRGAAWINVLVSVVTLAEALIWVTRWAGARPPMGGPGLWWTDPLTVVFLLLTATVGCTTSLFSALSLRPGGAGRRLGPRRLRIYYVCFQSLMGCLLTALTTNHLGLLWVALEGATLSSLLLFSLYRTAAALKAAWRYFVLCGVGLAAALFGTVLLYLAAESAGVAAPLALRWSALAAAHGRLPVGLTQAAFVFLVLGYGTKAAMAPMHTWLADIYAEAPPPVVGGLSVLLLNVALYAMLRVKLVAAPGFAPLLVGLGLTTLVAGAFSLSRARSAPRLFAYSTIAHGGLTIFLLGLGSTLAGMALLLLLVSHTLIKSAALFVTGDMTQTVGSGEFARLGVGFSTSPGFRGALWVSAIGLMGFPPFGLFSGEYLGWLAAVRAAPWALPVLAASFLAAFTTLLGRVLTMTSGHPPPGVTAPAPRVLVPVVAHLAIALGIGLWWPETVMGWLAQGAHLIGAST